MRPILPLSALLLATALHDGAARRSRCRAAAGCAPAADPAAEDARLLAFLDAAFDAQVEPRPALLTSLGIKRHYDRLNDHTDAHDQR